jgi:hypothetical protein
MEEIRVAVLAQVNRDKMAMIHSLEHIQPMVVEGEPELQI